MGTICEHNDRSHVGHTSGQDSGVSGDFNLSRFAGGAKEVRCPFHLFGEIAAGFLLSLKGLLCGK